MANYCRVSHFKSNMETYLVEFLVGRGKSDITPFIPGIVMLGYGNPKNTVTDVDTPISVRTFWIKSQSGQNQFIFINLEVCFITQALVDLVWENIKSDFSHHNLDRSQIIFTAQHTHSAPSGFTHYTVYNTPTEGFSAQVLKTLHLGVIDSLKLAEQKFIPSTLTLKKGQFKLATDISFNRSLGAHNNNEEIITPFKKSEQNQAVDRQMNILEFKDEKGLSGVITYFPVHCTNILWTNHYISPGNKGYASLYLEKKINTSLERNDFIAAFNQGDAGDVSPIYTPPWWQAFIPRDDLKMIELSKENGYKQYLGALEFLENEGVELTEAFMDSELIYIDMGNVLCDKEHLPKKNQHISARTSPGCLGVAFIRGSEGAGIVTPLAWIVITVTIIVKYFEYFFTYFKSEEWASSIKQKYASQDPKKIFVETGAKKILGFSNVLYLIIPGFVDSSIKYFKKIFREGSAREHTWTQHILPIQISIINGYVFVGIPAETTTMAGKRLRKALSDVFSTEEKFKEVILCPYSNAYCGYITTPEEYEKQDYEGGHTLFGKWTQPAFQTELVKLAKEMLKPKSERVLNKDLTPPLFSKKELQIRAHRNQQI
jgi:neutral ceramidase